MHWAMMAMLIAVGCVLTPLSGGAISTRMIAVRLALGATPRAVVREAMTMVVTLAGIGVAVGASVSVWLWDSIRSMLFEVAPQDPTTVDGPRAPMPSSGDALDHTDLTLFALAVAGGCAPR